jgi:ribosomal protein S27AE
MTPYSPSFLESKKRKFPLVRISNELKRELDEAKDKLFPFRVTYNDVLSLLPRCPSCGALVLRLEKDVLTCWKCGKKYRLEEANQG